MINKQLVILRHNEKIISSFLESDKLSMVYVDDMEASTNIGNIYIGKVQNIVQNIHAAFVDIGGGTMCYLSIKGKNIKCGDELLVQVKGEGVKSKLPTVITDYNLTGRYVVLLKNGKQFSISNKLRDPLVLERLHPILSEMKESTNDDNGEFGGIIRTNAVDATSAEILSEWKILLAIAREMEATYSYKTCFSLLYQGESPVITHVRDGKPSEMERIITDDKEIYDQLISHFSQYDDFPIETIVFYEDSSYSLNHLLGIETQLEKALEKKTWLKSGGSIVIEPTEALTSIDVNTDKAIKGNRNPESTFLKINLEAAAEIARQLRIRNLSGIIIVDFIDMKKAEHKKHLLAQLKTLLAADPVKTVLVDMTPLGLVEITRMKTRKPLHEQIRYFS